MGVSAQLCAPGGVRGPGIQPETQTAHSALRTSPVEAPEGRANALRPANFLYQPALYFDYFAALLQEQPVSVEATPT